MHPRRLARTLLRALNFLAVVFWATTPLLILLSFYVPGLSFLVGSIGAVVSLAVIWAVSFLIVFFFLLLPQDSGKNHGLLGLLCTLTLGLPSIALAAFPLVGPPAYSEVPQLDFNRNGIRMLVAPARFFVAIDVSHSFWGTKPEDRIKMVSDAITEIFGEKGIVGSSMRASDALEIYTFAGKSDLWDTNESGSNDLLDRRMKILGSISQGALGLLKTESSCPDATDILTTLNTIVTKLKDPSRIYSFARVVLFSDLVHSIHASPGCENSGHPNNAESIEQATKSLLEQIRNLHDVSFVAFSAPPQGGALTSEGSDLNIPLQGQLAKLGDTRWQEIKLLSEWKTASPAARLLLPINLYADVAPSSSPLQIAYADYSDYPLPRSRSCRLDLRHELDFTRFVFGLKALNPGQKPFRINLKEIDGDALTLSLEPGEESSQLWRSEKANITPAVVELNCKGGIPNADHPELLVANPSRSLLYRMRIALVPYTESSEITKGRIILLILNILPIILGWTILSDAKLVPFNGLDAVRNLYNPENQL